MDKGMQRINLLLDTIDKGLMNAETIGYFTYAYLQDLLVVTRQMDNGRKLYREIKTYLENINLQRLHTQVVRGEKIVIGFIANCASTWIGDELYRLLEESEEFEPYVFLIPNHVLGQNDEEIRREYIENLTYFRTRDVRVVQTMDSASGVQYTWEQIGIKPQVCIWLTPWTDLFRGEFHLLSYSLDVVHTYIPYGIMIEENEKKNHVYADYDQSLHNMTWRNFEESKISVEMAERYAFVGSSNAVYTGYPKMDAFYKKDIEVENMWEALEKKAGNPGEGGKRVIYAPHHTIGEGEPIHFSTFASNYMFMLELAKKYQNETIWIFKPHPQLKYKAVREGVFADMDGYRSYEQRWKELKNAEVMQEGLYHKLFVESDAMILDSISFMAEYLYVNKPLLVLSRDRQRFNDFGSQLVKVHYRAKGTDYEGIEKFLTNVVLKGNDEKREERERFFENNLDYWKETGQSAAANIFEELKDGLIGRKTDHWEGYPGMEFQRCL